MTDMTDRRDIYKILDRIPLGEGGFARVWRAEHRQTSEVVALKQPRREPAARDRLRREIQVQTALAHPNVMPIVDHDPDGYGWFAMPVGTGNLYKLRPTVSGDELVDLLRGIIDGLAVAHQARYVHRDITPPNLIALPDPTTPEADGGWWRTGVWCAVLQARQLDR